MHEVFLRSTYSHENAYIVKCSINPGIAVGTSHPEESRGH